MQTSIVGLTPDETASDPPREDRPQTQLVLVSRTPGPLPQGAYTEHRRIPDYTKPSTMPQLRQLPIRKKHTSLSWMLERSFDGRLGQRRAGEPAGFPKTSQAGQTLGRGTGFQPVSGEDRQDACLTVGALIVTLRNAGNASTWGTFLTCRSSPTSTHRHVGNVPHIDEVTIKAYRRRFAKAGRPHKRA